MVLFDAFEELAAAPGQALTLAGLARLLRSAETADIALTRGSRTVRLRAAGLADLIERTLDARAVNSTSDADFDALLRSALSRAPRELGDHGPDCLDPAALAQARQFDAHLHGCARCARGFLDLDVPPPASPEDDAFDVAAGWRRLCHAGQE